MKEMNETSEKNERSGRIRKNGRSGRSYTSRSNEKICWNGIYRNSNKIRIYKGNRKSERPGSMVKVERVGAVKEVDEQEFVVRGKEVG